MSQNRPQAGERFLHFKKKLYQVITIAIHSETGEELVIYQALYGDYRIYARPLAMFTSEVDPEKYPEVTQKYRFELVSGEDFEEVSVGAAQPDIMASQPESAERPFFMAEGKEAEGAKAPYVTERRTSEQPKSERRSQFARQPKSAMVRKISEEQKNGELSIEELVMAFYDARHYERKYQILLQMEKGLTDIMIDNMAVSMDVVIPEGPLEKRYDELKRCVRTYAKYETDRVLK